MENNNSPKLSLYEVCNLANNLDLRTELNLSNKGSWGDYAVIKAVTMVMTHSSRSDKIDSQDEKVAVLVRKADLFDSYGIGLPEYKGLLDYDMAELEKRGYIKIYGSSYTSTQLLEDKIRQALADPRRIELFSYAEQGVDEAAYRSLQELSEELVIESLFSVFQGELREVTSEMRLDMADMLKSAVRLYNYGEPLKISELTSQYGPMQDIIGMSGYELLKEAKLLESSPSQSPDDTIAPGENLAGFVRGIIRNQNLVNRLKGQPEQEAFKLEELKPEGQPKTEITAVRAVKAFFGKAVDKITGFFRGGN